MQIPFEYADESEIPEGYQFFTVSNSNEWLGGWTPKHTIDTGIPEYLDYLKKPEKNGEN
jgi:hypothetical protein